MWRRKFLYAALYFSEGAPIGFLWWYLPAHLRASGVCVERITGLTAALALVWSLKFLWAPLLDRLRGARWGYRSWMLTAQVLMGLTLLPLVWIDPVGNFGLLSILTLAHAVSAATQDVAIDAMAIATTHPSERGGINGWMQVGMLLGRSLFGGLALAFAFESVLLVLCATIWLVGVAVRQSDLLVSPPPAPDEGHAVRRLFRALAHRRILLGLLFALVAGLAFEALGGVAGPYLIDRGYTKEELAPFLGVVAVAAMGAGALAGGWLSDRLGPARVAAAGVPLLAGLVAVVTMTSPGPGLLAALAAFYVTVGAFTAGSYALFMDLTDPRWAATQFTAFMAATNLCEAGAVFAAGRITGALGYTPALLAVATASLLAVPLVAPLRGPTAGDEAGADAKVPGTA